MYVNTPSERPALCSLLACIMYVCSLVKSFQCFGYFTARVQMTDTSKKWACTHYRHHTFPHPRPLHKYTAYAYKYVNRRVWACVYCVSYIHIYASGPKTVLVKRTFLLACVRRSWRGGVEWGRHVNVPCTSSATCCYAAQMSGSVASLYTWRGGVGFWG